MQIGFFHFFILYLTQNSGSLEQASAILRCNRLFPYKKFIWLLFDEFVEIAAFGVCCVEKVMRDMAAGLVQVILV